MSDPSVFTDQTYTAPPERVRRMTEAILGRVKPDFAGRILEIGCGTGGQLLSLAGALPASQLTGVDISEPCILQANEARERSPHRQRLRFSSGNYAATPLPEGFDVIFADSVLHLMETTDAELLTKLETDLLPGGLLIFSIPYSCAFNHLLWTVRRGFRLVRSPWTDNLILAAARKLHRHDMSDELLGERIHYMYLLPHRYWGRRLQSQFQQVHLETLETQAVPHASWAQPKHVLVVCRKTA